MAAKKHMTKVVTYAYYSAEKYDKVNCDNKKYLRMYFDYLFLDEGVNFSEKTEKAHKRILETFFIYLYEFKDNMSVLNINAGDITEYFDWYMTKRNHGKIVTDIPMKHKMEGCISRFFKYLAKRKFIEVNPFQFVEKVDWEEYKKKHNKREKK